MKIKKIEQPVAAYGQWEVYQDGTIKAKYTSPSGRESQLHIYPERLTEPDLVLTIMADRVTTEWNNFWPAFMLACQMAGIKYIPNFQVDFE